MRNYGNICFGPSHLKYSGIEECLDAHPRALWCLGAVLCHAKHACYSITVLTQASISGTDYCSDAENTTVLAHEEAIVGTR